MSGKLFSESGGGFRGWATAALLCIAVCGVAARAETAPVGPSPAGAPAVVDADGAVVQAGCASCEAGLLGQPPAEMSDIGSCGCSSGCVPGRRPCDCCCNATDGPGRFLCGIYQCICCPDPCYEPHWTALADSSFFQTSGPRPVTEMRLRYQHAWDMHFPDKAEFFMPRSDGAPGAKGPKQIVPVITGDNNLSYGEFHMYNEAAIGKFSTWIDMPYRNIETAQYNGASGFGDLTIGTKSMLLDCELLQFTFEFNTFTPTGNFLKGLGTGHVSLEPGFLIALKLAPETYLQSELAYRIPIGGDQNFQGSVFHAHVSLNQLLWHCGHDIQLIGTAELNSWTFEGGEFTAAGNTLMAPVDGTLSSEAAAEVLNVGPGVRLVICDKIDFGVAGYFNLASGSLGQEFVQAEFRWRF